MCLSYEGHVQIFMKSCFKSGTFLTFSVNPYRTHDMLHTFAEINLVTKRSLCTSVKFRLIYNSQTIAS